MKTTTSKGRGWLTDGAVRKMVKEQTPKAVSDGGGLTFTVSKTGAGAWILRYRFGGRQREYTIGRWPDWTLKQAREEALRLRLRVAAGEHIAETKRADRVAERMAGTVAELAEDYLTLLAGRVRASTLRQRRRLFATDILPTIGRFRPDTLPREEISALIRRIAKRSHPTAIIAMVAIRGMFAHGVSNGTLERDPTENLKTSALIGTRTAPDKRRKLDRIELPRFLAAVEQTGAANAAAIKLLLLTGARKSELQTARWVDVDLVACTWCIPDTNKTGRPFTIPLAPQSIACFQRLRTLYPTSEFVMSQHGGRSHGKATSPGRLNFAMDSIEGLGKITPHNLRHTMRSYLGELGTRVEVAERCLNHSLGGLVEVYDLSDYMDERRAALEKWAAFLDSLCRGTVVEATFGKAA